MEREGDYLIVGLGNPGKKYERTRHNLGFLVVEAFAKKHSLSFKRGWRLQGKTASGIVQEKKVHLLMPTTYMNLSGTSVQRALHFFSIPPDRLMVIVDDVYVKFGAMRLRDEGGTGGHNGLKSIQGCLGTQKYPRLRMGVGPEDEKLFAEGRQVALEEYVLANFTPCEQQKLQQVVENGASVVEEWLRLGSKAASSLAGNISQVG